MYIHTYAYYVANNIFSNSFNSYNMLVESKMRSVVKQDLEKKLNVGK